jgi:pimeloyl-ACP methyl ester carboxylesterase
MATATIDGIETRYEVAGSGPALLMFSPGGFDATVEKWSSLGVYARVKLLDHLPGKFTCVMFDRRETGQSGGRVEAIGWEHYVAQGKGLLDYLKIPRAHLMGGCMGCSPVAAFAVAYPQGHAQHAALVAGGRREVPHQGAAAFRRPPRLRREERPRRRGRAGAAGRKTLWSRAERRPLGIRDQARSGFRRALREARHAAIRRDREGDA